MVDRIVFLDRDGVINQFPGKGMYVTDLSRFTFVPGSVQAIRMLKEAGFELFVVSNQGCVSRGLISKEGLDVLTTHMNDELGKHGGKLDGVFYCPHQTSDACDCKKPKTTLFKKAVEGRDVEWKETFYVGDSEEDMAAGKALGCKTVLVLSGRTGLDDVKTLRSTPDYVKKDLWEAAEWIIRRKS